jgi:hypothetical protein
MLKTYVYKLHIPPILTYQCIQASIVTQGENNIFNGKTAPLKAILRVSSNPAVLALLEITWLLFESQYNNEVLRDLIIIVV